MMSCSNYDYIEIVCLFKYPVEIELKTGEIVTGLALDTVRNDQREECIKLKLAESELLVILDSMVRLTVLVENSHFQEVIFD